jgi:tetratricopeptide (TPR) repeat protein
MSGIGAPALGTTRVGRNDPCGSGRKFKQCCEGKDQRYLAGTAQKPPASPAAPQRLRALTAQAKKHWAAGNWAGANLLYQEIVRLDPTSAQAQMDLGVTCLQLGRLAEATAKLQGALELRPGLANALNHLARALELQGRTRDASLAYRKLSRAADDATPALLSQGADDGRQYGGGGERTPPPACSHFRQWVGACAAWATVVGPRKV